MASWQTADAPARDDEPLNLTQAQALLPLSPSTARAFSKAFRGNAPESKTKADGKGSETSSEKGEVKLEMKLEPEAPPPMDDEARLSPKPSPSPEKMAGALGNRARRQPEIMSMSLSEMKVDSAEVRRARRSEIERQSRQRRMGGLRNMRREVKQLEDLHTQVLERKILALTGLDEDRYEASQLASVQDFQQKYSDLSLVALALQEDGVELRKAVQRYEDFQREAKNLIERDGDEPVGPNQGQSPVYDSGVPHSSSFSVKFKPLTVPQCYAFVRDTCAAVTRFDASEDFVSTGANFMGWRDRRKYEPKTQRLQFGIRKTFTSEKSAEDLLMRTWNILRDPAEYAKVYFRATARMRREIVQIVDDDLYIVRMYFKRPGTPYTVTTVLGVFRVETPTGFTLVEHTIPSPEIKNALEPHEHFYHLFHWTHFNQLYDENGLPSGTEFNAGGALDNVLERASSYWLFEILLYTLRWESYVVAPLFLKET